VIYEITILSVPPNKFSANEIFCDVRLECHSIEGDLDAILSCPVASTIPKWRTFRLLSWVQSVQQSMWDHHILYADRSSKDEQIFMRQFLWKTKNTNVEGG
jgi:hypothetical protein